MKKFILSKTYELVLDQNNDFKIIRIELFNTISIPLLYRTRVWLQNTYNLHPTFINPIPQCENLKPVHSSDQMNMEITLLIATTPDWILGVSVESEEHFMEQIEEQIAQYFTRPANSQSL